MSRPPAICLIGPGHVASNPRLVKEADALHAAGFRVRVVSGTSHPLVEPLDRALLASRPWPTVRVRLGPKWRRVPGAIRSRVSARLAWGGWSRTPGATAYAESELVSRLARAAEAEPADLYIGHYPAGLYAAWRAARRHGSAFGFDAEDSHVDELPDDAEHAGRQAAREAFECALLPQARHFTAASPLIADAYERRYGIKPVTVLNVFPRSEAPPVPFATPHLRRAGPPTLYWFSQTIGPGRGLERVVAAMGRMNALAVLHLRGIPAAGYRERLEAHAAAVGAAGRVIWHSPAQPDQMARLSVEYDLGLALELTNPANRAICLTNKAFTYLLAGVPVVLSRTPAQERLAGELGAAARVVDLEEPLTLAAAINGWLADRVKLAQSRKAAWELGQTRFNWDFEQNRFLQSVRAALHVTQGGG